MKQYLFGTTTTEKLHDFQTFKNPNRMIGVESNIFSLFNLSKVGKLEIGYQ